MNRLWVAAVVLLMVGLSACAGGNDTAGPELLPAGGTTPASGGSTAGDDVLSTVPVAPSVADGMTFGVPGGLVIESFDGPEGASLADVSAQWAPLTGAWTVGSGRARVTIPSEGQPSLAIMPASPDGLIQITMAQVANQSGLVFRLVDANDYWALVAAPQFATWNVVRVVDGEAETIGNVGVAPVAPLTTVGVLLDGDEIRVLVQGRTRLLISDATHQSGSWTGLIASGPATTEARWDELMLLAVDLAPVSDAALEVELDGSDDG